MPWNESNPLYRWKKAHGKLNKAKRSYKYTVRPMAKRRKGRVRRYARRGRTLFRRHRSKMTIPIAPIVGIIAMPAVQGMIASAMQGNFQEVANFAPAIIGMRSDTGQFDSSLLIANMTPLAVGMGVHILASKLGVNRMLGKAKIPYIRI